jgi:hypothetical protein
MNTEDMGYLSKRQNHSLQEDIDELLENPEASMSVIDDSLREGGFVLRDEKDARFQLDKWYSDVLESGSGNTLWFVIKMADEDRKDR